VLQHRFRFGWRDDFHVVQSLVQAGPRWAVGLDDASPSNAGFAVPSGLLFCGANLAATRLHHPHLRCGFCFVKTRSLVGWAAPARRIQNQQGVFPAPTDYRLVAAPVRARKTRFKPKKSGLHNKPRRAVDCAPYLTSATPRLRGKPEAVGGTISTSSNVLCRSNPCTQASSDEGSPPNAEFTAPLEWRAPSQPDW